MTMKYEKVKMIVEDRGDRWGTWMCPRCGQENETNLSMMDEYDRMLDGCDACWLAGYATAPHDGEGYHFVPKETRNPEDMLAELVNAMKEMAFIVEGRRGGSLGLETDNDEAAGNWRALNRRAQRLQGALSAILGNV